MIGCKTLIYACILVQQAFYSQCDLGIAQFAQRIHRRLTVLNPHDSAAFQQMHIACSMHGSKFLPRGTVRRFKQYVIFRKIVSTNLHHKSVICCMVNNLRY